MSELPGILNWAIQGCLEWQEHGLQTPLIVEDQVAEYKSAMDSISQFIRDECEQKKNNTYAFKLVLSDNLDGFSVDPCFW